MYKGLGHIAIRTRDIEKSLLFYKEVLGFEEAFRMNEPDGNPWIIYLSVVPGQFIELFPNGTIPSDLNNQTIGFTHVCFEVDDAHAVCELLRRKGAPIDKEVALGRSGGKQFWTHDPDGNPIELMELPATSLQSQAVQRLLSTNEKP